MMIDTAWRWLRGKTRATEAAIRTR